MSDMCCWFVKV